jgi:hypothetical protein
MLQRLGWNAHANRLGRRGLTKEAGTIRSWHDSMPRAGRVVKVVSADRGRRNDRRHRSHDPIARHDPELGKASQVSFNGRCWTPGFEQSHAPFGKIVRRRLHSAGANVTE